MPSSFSVKIGGVRIGVDSARAGVEVCPSPQYEHFDLLIGDGCRSSDIRVEVTRTDADYDCHWEPPDRLLQLGLRGEQLVARFCPFGQTRVFIVADEQFSSVRIEATSLGLQLQPFRPIIYPTDAYLLLGKLGPHRAALLHASGVVVEGEALLFVGEADAGKSTIAQLFHEKGHPLLADDNVLITQPGATDALAHPTPWSFRTKHTWEHPAKLKAILMIEKGSDHSLLPTASDGRTVQDLLRNTRRLHGTQQFLQTLSLWHRLLSCIPCYRLVFSRHESVVEYVMGRLE